MNILPLKIKAKHLDYDGLMVNHKWEIVCRHKVFMLWKCSKCDLNVSVGIKKKLKKIKLGPLFLYHDETPWETSKEFIEKASCANRVMLKVCK